MLGLSLPGVSLVTWTILGVILICVLPAEKRGGKCPTLAAALAEVLQLLDGVRELHADDGQLLRVPLRQPQSLGVAVQYVEFENPNFGNREITFKVQGLGHQALSSDGSNWIRELVQSHPGIHPRAVFFSISAAAAFAFLLLFGLALRVADAAAQGWHFSPRYFAVKTRFN
jgi:hypothetical protein